jgi:hypothetical protein
MYIRQLLTIDIDLSLFIFLGRIWDGECLFAQFVVDPYVMVSLGSIFEPMPSAAAFVCGPDSRHARDLPQQHAVDGFALGRP